MKINENKEDKISIYVFFLYHLDTILIRIAISFTYNPTSDQQKKKSRHWIFYLPTYPQFFHVFDFNLYASISLYFFFASIQFFFFLHYLYNAHLVFQKSFVSISYYFFPLNHSGRYYLLFLSPPSSLIDIAKLFYLFTLKNVGNI